eukprot:755677-Hanusia_phi.AAC.10
MKRKSPKTEETTFMRVLALVLRHDRRRGCNSVTYRADEGRQGGENSSRKVREQRVPRRGVKSTRGTRGKKRGREPGEQEAARGMNEGKRSEEGGREERRVVGRGRGASSPGVGTAEAEAVGHDAVDLQDVEALRLVADVLDVRRLSQEVVLHHQDGVDRLVDTSSSAPEGQQRPSLPLPVPLLPLPRPASLSPPPPTRESVPRLTWSNRRKESIPCSSVREQKRHEQQKRKGEAKREEEEEEKKREEEEEKEEETNNSPGGILHKGSLDRLELHRVSDWS